MVRFPALPFAAMSAVALTLTACADPDPVPADVGGDGTTEPLAYDGAWEEADFDARAQGAFLNVWGTGPDDIYTVGGQVDDGVAWHFDGTTWSELDLPAGPQLYWVCGVDGELFIVGREGRALHRGAGASVFTELDTGATEPLWGCWGPSADQLYAVGGDPADPESEPFMIEWNGATWSEVVLPEPDREARALFKVWGSDASNVWAVGSRGLIYYWNGETWAQQGSGTADDLISLWGTGADDVVAVGGRSNGVLARYDGNTWTSQTLVGTPGLNGVWVDSEGTAHANGLRSTQLRIPAGTFEVIDEEVQSTDPAVVAMVMHGIWGIDGGIRVSVGGSLLLPPPYQGIVVVDF
jgi:hypothetical protein